MSLFNIEPKHKSAADAIKWRLTKYGHITQLECINRYGTWRLSQYIMVMRRSGLNIVSEEKKVKTRFGWYTSIVVYRLIK